MTEVRPFGRFAALAALVIVCVAVVALDLPPKLSATQRPEFRLESLRRSGIHSLQITSHNRRGTPTQGATLMVQYASSAVAAVLHFTEPAERAGLRLLQVTANDGSTYHLAEIPNLGVHDFSDEMVQKSVGGTLLTFEDVAWLAQIGVSDNATEIGPGHYVFPLWDTGWIASPRYRNMDVLFDDHGVTNMDLKGTDDESTARVLLPERWGDRVRAPTILFTRKGSERAVTIEVVSSDFSYSCPITGASSMPAEFLEIVANRPCVPPATAPDRAGN